MIVFGFIVAMALAQPRSAGTGTCAPGGILWCTNGSSYSTIAAGNNGDCLLSGGANTPTWGSCSSGGAPTDATYITQTANSSLSAEQAMGALGTGIVINTTTTGVQSIYAGASCTNQFPRALSASGAPTCATVSLTADVTGTLPQGNGGSGSTALTCSSGQALTSNGTNYSCTSTITASAVTGANVSGAVATATALAANPADCGANAYATTIAVNGDLTCAQVTTAQLSGTITDAQLASNYSGIGACGANTFASTLNDNAAPTCTQPAFSNLSGTISIAQQATNLKRIITTNVTNSTVTPATTGLSWAVAANTEYGFMCALNSSGTATSLARFNLNGPAAATTVVFSTARYTTTAAQTLLVLQAFSAAAQTAACTSACTTTVLPTYIYGTIVNGANAGTADLQVASSTAGQAVVVYRGSYCQVF